MLNQQQENKYPFQGNGGVERHHFGWVAGPQQQLAPPPLGGSSTSYCSGPAAACGCLCTLSTDAACQLDVLGHDGHTLGVDGTQVGVLKQAHQVCLSCLLQGQHCAALEAQVGLEILG